MREGGVHPWQPQAGHEDVDEAGQHQIPVEGRPFQQPGHWQMAVSEAPLTVDVLVDRSQTGGD